MSHQIKSINREKKYIKDQTEIPDWKSRGTEVLTRSSQEQIWVGKGIIKPEYRSTEVIQSEEWKEKWMTKNEEHPLGSLMNSTKHLWEEFFQFPKISS